MTSNQNLNKIKQPRYTYFIICVTSVLFVFGIIGWLILGSTKVEKVLRERFLVHIYLKDEASQDAKDQLIDQLKSHNYVKSLIFKSKEAALKDWLKNGGEEFLNPIGENVLPESIVINIKSKYVNDTSIAKIKSLVVSNEIVSDIQYPSSIFGQFVIIKKICFYLSFIAVFLIMISLVVLGYLIRLIIFNNRFVIRTMTLVGASSRYISKPFEYRAILNGSISSILAMIGIAFVAWYLQNTFYEIRVLMDKKIFLIVFCFIAFLGIFISWLSTYVVISRYLKAPLEKLY